MPIIKSAKKRVRIAHKATVRNAKTRRTFRQAVKAFEASLASKSKAAEAHRKAQSELGKAAKKHVIHKNKLARKQRQLARAAKAANVKLAGAGLKATTKVAAKTAAKPKSAPKKTAAKKSPTKKPTSKK